MTVVMDIHGDSTNSLNGGTGLATSCGNVASIRIMFTYLSLGLCVHADSMVHRRDSKHFGVCVYPKHYLTGQFASQLGPIIGGSLARPVDRFPSLFGNNEFLKKYPYFLPCAVPATFSLLAWTVTCLFLKETVVSPTPISELIGLKKEKKVLAESARPEITQVGSSIKTTPVVVEHAAEDGKILSLRELLTFRVVIAAGNYASLSLIDIAFRAVQPLFFSTPIDMGGMGLPPPIIGNILSLAGILNGLFQVFFFAQINDRYGSKKLFITGMASAIPIFATFPLLNYLARVEGYSTLVWAVVLFQIVMSIAISLAYGELTLSPLDFVLDSGRHEHGLTL